MYRFLLLMFVLSASVAGAEPLWTEGAHGHHDSAMSMQSFIKLARTLGPAVVNVVAIQAAEEPNPNAPNARRGRGQGTGFIIQKDGYILTNTHVVEGADDIRVRLSDDRELTGRLVGKDERTDIAVLKIEAGGALPVAPLGNSDELQIGEWVMAIGNPFGLDHTVTAGIVSAKGRRDVRPGGGQTGFYDFIQTDASINPGNSGGPLINTRGEVIGINTAMNAQAQGIGFAIPINMVKVIAPMLKEHGGVQRSWMGVFPQSITASLKRAFQLKDTHGALVAEVVPDSPAAAVGVRSGDVITEFNGHSIGRSDDLMWLVATTLPGKKVPLTIVRGGEQLKVDLTLNRAPGEQDAAPAVVPAKPKGSALGMTVAEVTPGVARELGNAALRGVVVMSVEPDSPAVEAGVERGDLIMRVNDTVVKQLDDYAKVVRAVAHGDIIKMLVRREGKSAWVAFTKR